MKLICSFCDAESVVEVNGRRGCQEHIDNAMSAGLIAVRHMREMLEDVGGDGDADTDAR